MEGAKKSKIKLSFIVLAVAIVVSVISFAYGAWVDAKSAQELVPKLAADSMVKSLRQFQRQTGQFPENFMELEERVWKHRKVPDFGQAKKTLTVANYYYMYGKADALTCTVWAIPSGPKREEASTQFFVITPEVIRRWKGPALSKGDIDKLVAVPTVELLAMVGMTEQSIVDQRSGGKSSSLASSPSN